MSKWGVPRDPKGLLSHHDLLWRIGGYEPERGAAVAGHRGYVCTCVTRTCARFMFRPTVICNEFCWTCVFLTCTICASSLTLTLSLSPHSPSTPHSPFTPNSPLMILSMYRMYRSLQLLPPRRGCAAKPGLYQLRHCLFALPPSSGAATTVHDEERSHGRGEILHTFLHIHLYHPASVTHTHAPPRICDTHVYHLASVSHTRAPPRICHAQTCTTPASVILPHFSSTT